MTNVKDSIGWADFTWNPVTGCKRNCEYCYARKIHNRFNNYPFNKIIFHPDRIREPEKVKKPSNIFPGSMSDIEFWEPSHTQIIIDNCYIFNWHIFMFLSKNPASYLNFEWPSNTMQGLTVEMPGNKILWDYIVEISSLPHPFLSIEPINGGLWNELPDNIELVIVGAETGNRKNKAIPQPEWIRSVKDHVPENKIYWKNNIRKYLEGYGL